MANFSSDLRSSGCLECSNELHNGFGHTFLFPALVEERQMGHMTTPDLIKKCLRKSGLPFHSLESLQLHSCLFHNAFLPLGAESNMEESVSDRFSTHDYFHAILDQELGWFRYYKQMVPFVRLPLAVNVVTTLEEFYSQLRSEVKQMTQTVLLLTSTLEMFYSVVYDLYSELEDGHETHQKPSHTCSSGQPQEGLHSSHLKSLCEELSDKVIKCLDILLTELSERPNGMESNSPTNCIESKSHALRCVIEILSLTLVVVDPFTSATEIRDSFKQLKVGRVDLLHNPIALKAMGKKSLRHDNSSGLENEVTSKEVCIKRLSRTYDSSDTVHTENVDIDNKVSEKLVSRNGTEFELMQNSSYRTQNDVETNDLISETLTDRKREKEFSQYGVEDDYISHFILNIFRQKVSAKLFIKIVSYFSRGEDKINKSFYNNLSAIINDDNNFQVGDHIICRVKLFLQVEKLLRELTREKKHNDDESGSSAFRSDNYELLNLLSSVDVYPDRKQFNLSPAEEVLASGRQLSGVEDLTLLKLVTKECMTGWHDLIVLGMQNLDFESWWNCGFYDLVLRHADYLSTESNVQQVLFVLYNLSKENPICWEYVTKMTELLNAMLCKLPSLLQEEIVTSSNISTCEEQKVSSEYVENDVSSKQVTTEFEGRGGDRLAGLKSREEVLKDVTTLLNRLTCDNVHQLLSDALMLCLYCKEAVLTQALQAAIDNKGQIEPVVMLLRLIPGVCNLLNASTGKSMLMSSLGNVVLSTKFDERTEENMVQLLNLLSQGYERLLDSKSNISHWFSDGVFTVTEFMDTVILPAFERKMTNTIKVSETLTTSHIKSSTEVVINLPISTIFQCFACLVQTVSSDKLHCLHGVVMVRFLATLCVHHWPLFVTDDSSDSDDGSFLSKGGDEAVWQGARKCMDCLIERLKIEDTLDSASLDWLLDKSYHQDGLPCLVLVYPLLQQHSDLQMISILELLVKENLDGYSILNLLLGLGQVNEAICQTMTNFIDRDDITPLISITRQQFISLVAKVLSQSLACDLTRTCYMLRSLVSQYFSGKVELNQDLINFIELAKLDRDAQTKCLLVQYLTDGLMLVLCNQAETRSPTCITTKAIVNYVMACQTLLEGKPNPQSSSVVQGQGELLVYTFIQCCSLLCLPSVSSISHAFQGLNVLAMTLLTNLTDVFSQKENGQAQSRKPSKEIGEKGRKGESEAYRFRTNPKYDVELKDEGNECNITRVHLQRGEYAHKIGSSHKKNGSSEFVRVEEDFNESEINVEVPDERGRGKEWLDADLILSLRDLATNIRDKSVVKQLENQLGKLWIVIGLATSGTNLL